MTTTWFSSDIHFGHKNIIEFCNRPWETVDEMNEGIIENFNRFISPEDTLILVGDLCMGRKDDTIPLLGRINGTKIVVPGNHDPMHPAHEKRDWKRNEWIDRYTSEAGVVIGPTMTETVVGGDWVVLCHFPYTGDSGDEERFTEYRPLDLGRWLIHGHVHDAWQVNGRQINVGVDVWSYNPVHIDTIREIISNG